MRRQNSNDSFSKLRSSQIVCETERKSEQSTASDEFEMIDKDAAKLIEQEIKGTDKVPSVVIYQPIILMQESSPTSK